MDYLTWLAALLAWPLLYQLPRRRIAVHIGIAPLAVMLPCYLGYATLSFTSVGPSGGILYPFVALFASAPLRDCLPFLNGLNSIVYEYLPPILSPMSIGVGEPLAISGRGMPGPMQMLLIGVIPAAAVLVWKPIKTVVGKTINNRESDSTGNRF